MAKKIELKKVSDDLYHITFTVKWEGCGSKDSIKGQSITKPFDFTGMDREAVIRRCLQSQSLIVEAQGNIRPKTEEDCRALNPMQDVHLVSSGRQATKVVTREITPEEMTPEQRAELLEKLLAMAEASK